MAVIALSFSTRDYTSFLLNAENSKLVSLLYELDDRRSPPMQRSYLLLYIYTNIVSPVLTIVQYRVQNLSIDLIVGESWVFCLRFINLNVIISNNCAAWVKDIKRRRNNTRKILFLSSSLSCGNCNSKCRSARDKSRRDLLKKKFKNVLIIKKKILKLHD